MRASINIKLFKKAFKGLIPIGLSLTFIAVVASIIIILTVNGRRYNMEYIPLSQWIAILICLAYVSPIFLMFKALAFYHKRQASDLYETLPNTKQAVFLSHLLAVLTWLIIIQVSGVLTIAMIKGVTGQLVRNTDIWCGLLSNLSISLYLTAALALAISLTGNVFNAVIVGGLLSFLPGWLTAMFSGYVSFITQTVSERSIMIGLLWAHYNLAFSSAYAVVSPGAATSLQLNAFLFLRYAIITLLHAMVYGGLAYFFFTKRPAEVAGNASLTKWLRNVYRIGIAFTFLALAFTGLDWSFAIFAAFIATALYEIITTKSGKHVIKTLPSLLVVILAVMGMRFVGDKVSERIINNIPDTSDVESVTIYQNALAYYSPLSILEKNNDVEDCVTITDQSIIDIYINGLKQAKIMKNNMERFNYEQKHPIIIKTKQGKVLHRSVPIEPKQEMTLKQKLFNSEEFRQELYSVPKITKADNINPIMGIKDGNAKLAIYNAYREELQELYTTKTREELGKLENLLLQTQWIYTLHGKNTALQYGNHLIWSIYYYQHGYMFNERISSELLPKTSLVYIQESNQYYEQYVHKNKEVYLMGVGLIQIDESKWDVEELNKLVNTYLNQEDKELRVKREQAVQDILQVSDREITDATMPIALLSFGENSEFKEIVYRFIPLNDEVLAEIYELVE